MEDFRRMEWRISGERSIGFWENVMEDFRRMERRISGKWSRRF